MCISSSCSFTRGGHLKKTLTPRKHSDSLSGGGKSPGSESRNPVSMFQFQPRAHRPPFLRRRGIHAVDSKSQDGVLLFEPGFPSSARAATLRSGGVLGRDGWNPSRPLSVQTEPLPRGILLRQRIHSRRSGFFVLFFKYIPKTAPCSYSTSRVVEEDSALSF